VEDVGQDVEQDEQQAEKNEEMIKGLHRNGGEMHIAGRMSNKLLGKNVTGGTANVQRRTSNAQHPMGQARAWAARERRKKEDRGLRG
jgi:hypothetical protein